MAARSVTNVRGAPDTASPVVGRLRPGDVVLAGPERDKWRTIYGPDGASRAPMGHVYATLLEPAPDPQDTPGQADAEAPKAPAAARSDATSDAIPKYHVAGVEVEGGRKTITVILDVDRLPSDKALQRMAWNLWFQERRQREEMHLYIYLPDMDPRDLAYAIARFYKGGMSEFRTRKSVLYGTKWLD
jgi:hypothetical protein